MEDEETLEPGAGVNELPDPVEDQVDDLLPDGVVASSVVVSRILLPRDQLLGVEQLPVGPQPDLCQSESVKLKVKKKSVKVKV